MAHPYTTRERVRQQAGSSSRVLELIDYDQNDTEDTIDGSLVLDVVIEDACNTVDARLGKRYPVPFDTYPSTPALVTQITNYLVLWDLYERVSPGGDDAKSWLARADGLMTGLLDGSLELPATAEVSVDTRRPVLSESGGTLVAGRTSDNVTTYTANSRAKTYGI
jgi:phage gp36-like protein